MTTYNTYQEAKIANPESNIFFMHNGEYRTGEWIDQHNFGRSSFTLCNPADHCITVEKFLADGHKFVKSDVVFDFGDVVSIDTEFDVETYNKTDKMDDRRYILRAAALENIPTETPEEKEVLDSIESAGEVEWKSGDLLEFMGEPCVFVSMLNGFPVVKYTEDADRSLAGCFDEIIAVDRLKKPKTPQQRKDRERLEVIDEMCWDVHSLKFSQASALYEAGYRKEKIHGTN